MADTVVFFTSWPNKLYGIDAATGEELLSGELLASRSSPTLVDGHIFIGVDEVFAALDLAGDGPGWVFEIGGGDWIFSSPTVVDGIVYFGANDGHLYAGVESSSMDSRVLLGTLGHHDRIDDAPVDDNPVEIDDSDDTNDDPVADDDSDDTDDDPDDTTARSGDDEYGGGHGVAPVEPRDGDADDADDLLASTEVEEQSDDANGDDDADDDSLPGPGIIGAVGGIVGAGYLLQWWRGKERDGTE